MYGKKVKIRAFFIILVFTSAILITFLVINSLKENVVFFKSPTDINNLNQIESKKIRVGGMVKKNSIEIENKNLKFVITDFISSKNYDSDELKDIINLNNFLSNKEHNNINKIIEY